MGMHESLTESKVITFALLVAGLWLVVGGLHVLGIVQASFGGGAMVGQTGFSGVLGLLVMVAILGLMVWLYAEVSDAAAQPASWPPE